MWLSGLRGQRDHRYQQSRSQTRLRGAAVNWPITVSSARGGGTERPRCNLRVD